MTSKGEHLMNQSDDLEYQLDTLAIRTGHTRSFEGEHGEPIFLTSSFVYENAAEAAAKFSGQVQGNIYSRFTNPTVSMFEKRLAALDGTERAVATSSGMGAILSVAMAYLKAGDHVICSRAVFGSVVALFEKYTAEQKLLSYTIAFEGESVIVTRYTDNMQSMRNLQNEMSDLYNNFGLAWKDILQRFNWESQYTFEEATYPPA